MLIVADSSPLIALTICDALDVLDQLFEEVKVPPAVRDEVSVEGKPHAKTLRRYLDDKVEPVDLAASGIAAGRLGRGELEAMALYKKLRADFLLIDDSRGRHAARLNGIVTIGTLGILRRAKEKGVLARIKPYTDRLRASALCIDESLIRDVLRAAGE